MSTVDFFYSITLLQQLVVATVAVRSGHSSLLEVGRAVCREAAGPGVEGHALSLHQVPHIVTVIINSIFINIQGGRSCATSGEVYTLDGCGCMLDWIKMSSMVEPLQCIGQTRGLKELYVVCNEVEPFVATIWTFLHTPIHRLPLDSSCANMGHW